MVVPRKFINRIVRGECLEVLKQLPDESIDCIVTSPPYYGLRDYGMKKQIGLESTFEEYLQNMLAVTAELKRVLKKEGTLWWNHGDCYGGAQGKFAGWPDQQLRNGEKIPNHRKPKNLAKCLLMQPYRFAQRMIDEQHWILRNIIIWHKPNCMPSSAKDRFTVNYECVFFFVKNKKYFFDQQLVPVKQSSIERLARAVSNNHKWVNGPDGHTKDRLNRPRSNQTKHYKGAGNSARENNCAIASHQFAGGDYLVSPFDPEKGRNMRSVWSISSKPFSEAHFAVFPPELVETPIRAGCPEFVCKRCGKGREKILEGRSRNAFGLTARDAKAGRLKAKWGVLQKPMPHHEKYEGDKAYAGKGKKFVGYTDCGCNAGFEPGIVLDPFMGSGTTALVASRLGRKYVGIELNPDYIEIAEKRLREELEPKKAGAGGRR